MDMIALTRELGKAIQQDERYIALQVAPNRTATRTKPCNR